MELEIKKSKSVSLTVMKKALCIFMSVLMLFSTFGSAMSVFATDGLVTDGNIPDRTVVDSGFCGNDTTYTLYSDGELVISGEGGVGTYYEGCSYWEEYSSDILTVIVEEGITYLGDDVFSSHRNLVDVTLPDSLTHIGNHTFAACSSLKSLTIPANVNFIAAMVFWGCSNLTEINVEENNWRYYSIDGVLFDGGELICYPAKKADTVYEIPNGITSIDYWAFYDNFILKNVVVPDSMITISEGAFQYCLGLTSVTIPDSVTAIEENAFSSCESLTDVYYEGTEAQWNSISVSDYNEYLTNANIHFNWVGNVTDGDVSDDNVSDGNVTDGDIPEVEEPEEPDFDYTDISCGETLSVSEGGHYYRFIPEKSAIYCFTSSSDGDPWCRLYNANEDELNYSDDANGLEFELTHYLEAGKTYYFSVGFYGFESYCDVTLAVNDIESISFTPVNDYVLTEGISSGYYEIQTVTDGNISFYYYHHPSYADGDKFTVNKINGTSIDYFYDSERECFLSDTDEAVSIDRYDNQYDNHWTPDGENNWLGVTYRGFKYKVPVTIYANPIESISFTPAEEYVLTEGLSDGYYDTRLVYDEENESEYEEKYYHFYKPSFKNGDKLTVNYSDGTSEDFIYDENNCSFGDLEEGAVWSNEYQSDNPWTVGGEHNYLEIVYGGRKYNVPVTVKANPVESVSFTPAEEYVLTEGFSSGRYTTRYVYDEETDSEYAQSYYYYNIPSFVNGDKFTVNYNDGTSEDFIYDEDNYSFGDLEEGAVWSNEYQSDNPWRVDGEHNYFTVIYASYECKVPVTVKANPVESVSFNPREEYVFTECLSDGYYTYRWVYDEETDSEYEERYYYYYTSSFVNGDKLTVKYSDGTSEDFIYDEENSTFGDLEEGTVRINEYQSDNPWTVGGEHNYFEIVYGGRKYNVPVTVKANPVESISFTPAENYVFTEGMSEGYYRTENVTDGNISYYYYDPPYFKEGDIFTFNFKDGTQKDYVYEVEYDEGEAFVSADGEKIWAGMYSNQDTNLWMPDGEHNYLLVKYREFECKVPVTVNANPVDTISYTPVKEIILTECISQGYYDTRWVDDYTEETFYYYEGNHISEGDTLTVNYADGTSVDYIRNEDGDFVSAEGEKVNIDRSSDQYSNPWVEGGEHNYFTVEYSGRKCKVPVTVRANPVESISFTPVKEYELTEGLSSGEYSIRVVGDEDGNINEYEYYRYDMVNFVKGDKITVAYKDATSKDYFNNGESDSMFVSEDGERIYVETDHNQHQYPWTPGGEHNYFTVEFAQKQVNVPVKINENPVESVSFTPVEEIVLLEEVSRGYFEFRDIYDEEEKYYDYSVPNFRNGDKIEVHYKGKASVTFTYNSEDDMFVSENREKIFVHKESRQYDNPWTPEGEHNYYYAVYAGRKAEVPVTIKENLTESIFFTPVKAYTFTELVSNGEYLIREVYDEATDSYFEEEYYHYYINNFEKGDKLTLRNSDGTKKDYIYKSDTGYFVSDDGISIYAEISYNQSENPWTVGGKHNYFKVKCSAYECVVPVTVNKNPVDSIVYTPVSEIILTEGLSSGEYETRYNCDAEGNEYEETFYRFDFPSYRKGDRITVNYADGTSVDYICERHDNFVSKDGKELDPERVCDQDRNPWKEDGKHNYFTVIHSGRRYNVPVTIRPNPVESISFNPVEEFVLTEGLSNGYYAVHDDEDGNSTPYYNFYISEFRKGDTLTVNYVNGTTEIWPFMEENRFVLDGRIIELGCYENQYDYHWTQDGTRNYFTAVYAGRECNVPVTVYPNPVESISFTPLEEYVLTEYVSEGNFDWRYEYNEETEEETEEEFYCYKRPALNNGDKVKVNYTDGTSTEFIYNEEEGLFAAEGKESIYVSMSSDQYDNPWRVNGKHNYITAEYAGRKYLVPVTINPCPVKDIAFTPCGEYVLTEGISDGYYTTRAYTDSQTGETLEEEYYYFEIPYFKNGDKFSVTYTDDSVVDYIFDDENGFVSENGTPIDFKTSANQHENPWVAEGEHNCFTVEYADKECSVPVTVKPNPIKSISFEAAAEYVYTEGVSPGYYTTTTVFDEENEDEYEVSFYYYYLRYNDGDKVTVNYVDGTSEEFVFEEDRGGFISSDGKFSDVEGYSDQYNNPWAPDGKHNYFTLEYAGRKCKASVTVKANPVASVSFIPQEEYLLIEGLSGGNYETCTVYDEETGVEYEEEFYYYYTPLFRKGDRFTVNYKDGTSADFLYKAKADNFTSKDGEELYFEYDENQYKNHWVAGGRYNYFTVEYAGQTMQVPVTVALSSVESVSATYKETLYAGYDCELGEWNSGVEEDYIVCTVKLTDGTEIAGTLDEIYEKYRANSNFAILISSIGVNEGDFYLGEAKGKLSVNVAQAPDYEGNLPGSVIRSNRLRVTWGEEIDVQLLQFADMGYTRNIDIIRIPEGLTLSGDGRLTGTVKNRGDNIIKFDVKWDDTFAHNLYTVYLEFSEESEKAKLPAGVPVIPFDKFVEVEARYAQPKWYKFRACTEEVRICFTNNLLGGMFDSEGRPVYAEGMGGFETTEAFYTVTRGDYYYLRLEGVGKIRVDSPRWMPYWSEDHYDAEILGEDLVANNVEKTFDGDSNTFWNVYEIESKFEIDYEGGFIEDIFGVMTRLASPVNIHMVGESKTNQDLIYSASYKYDPNNTEECEALGASTTQDTMADELREGEKEYRFDTVYYFAYAKGKLEITQKNRLYIPVGYVIDGNHVVKCEKHSFTKEVEGSRTESGCKTAGTVTMMCACGTTQVQTLELNSDKHEKIITLKAVAATCTTTGLTEGKKCTACGKVTVPQTETPILSHNWTAATCTTAKTCSVCGETEGKAKGHSWTAATCTSAKTCSVCKTTEGKAKGHSWTAATCTSAKTCSVCKVTEGKAKGHSWTNATCTTAKTCSVCKVTEGKAKGHSWTAATCTSAKTCSVCKVTEGKAKGHSWTAATCTTAKTCSVCKTTEGKVKGHNLETVTTKATLSKNGSTVTKCTACGYESGSETIWYPKTITLSKTAYTYNGKVQKPSVTVKDSKKNTLKEGTDYTVSYEKGCKTPGKYTVTITFKGKYSGTKALTFTIAPKATSKVTVSQTTTSITLKWKKVTGADGYMIYQLDSKAKNWKKIKTIKSGKTVSCKVKGLKAGTKYTFTVVAYTSDDGTISGSHKPIETATRTKTPALKVTSTAKGKAVFSWSDVSGESGYQVYYSTKKDSGFKKLNDYKANTKKGSKSKLKSGKKYYFKVRAYTKTKSGTVYSAWSSVKSVKVK